MANTQKSLNSLKKEDTADRTPVAKKAKLEEGDGDEITFRVSCKASGSVGKRCSGQDVARCIGGQLSRLLQWKVNFKTPDIEICIHINESYVTVGYH
ncbi:hypothetical protein ScPMuIL_014494 [Solemya velum]